MNMVTKSPHVTQKALLIREDGKILALRRSATCPRRPLTWDLPGGVVEYGEDLVESLKREVREEAGVAVTNPTLLDAVGYTIPEDEYWISIGYIARVQQDTAVTLSFEHDQFEWLTKEAFLARQTTDRIKRFLREIPTAQ